MVMKVSNVVPVMFRSSLKAEKQNEAENNQSKTIKELHSTVPDFAVKIPQSYTKLDTKELPGGLQIHLYKLANGHRVSIIPMEDSPTTVKNYVNVGSMNETDDIKGISHFLEHMAFNGTNGTDGYIKLNQGDSFKKIDELGGWANASTNFAITDYVNSSPLLEDKDLEQQLKVIAAMTEDLKLSNEMIEKEKSSVCSEINMILDNPQTIAIDQTVRSLFNIRSSADELVGGSTKHIKNLTRQQVLDYYNKYYVPTNMNLVITGNVDPAKTIELVAKSFKSGKTHPINPYEEKITPIKTSVRKDFISDKAESANVVLGFAGPKSNDAKSKTIFYIISNYLDSSKSNLAKELKKMNIYAGIDTEKISSNPNNPMLIYYAFDCADNKTEQALRTVFKELSTLKCPQNLDKIKEGLLKSYNDSLNYSNFVNNSVGNTILSNNLEYFTDYKKILNDITPEDVQSFIDKYLDLNKVAVTVVHPKTTLEEIQNNYNNAISFKGTRKPLNENLISSQILNNNYEIGFVQTKNNNLCVDINLHFNNKNRNNAAALLVLDKIYTMGTLKTSEDEWNEFQEDNFTEFYTDLSKGLLNISIDTDLQKFSPAFEKILELINHPAITEENLNTAKEQIKENVLRCPDSARTLYNNYDAKNNPLNSSKQEILGQIDSITLDDIKALHQEILNNSCGIIAMNIPNSAPEIKDEAIKYFEKLPKVKTKVVSIPAVYEPNEKPVVITKARAVSQADIMQTYKFPIEDSAKDYVTRKILNSILSSSSIGLFDTLREKEHLAYSVYSDLDKYGDSGELSLNILTTTDNIDTGEVSYDNIKKSINGFNRQIQALRNSKFTDKDLENAKKSLKASLLNRESLYSKVCPLTDGLYSKDGTNAYNKIYETIDSITREDINNLAERIFKTAPVYTIVASQASLDANKEFLESL